MNKQPLYTCNTEINKSKNIKKAFYQGVAGNNTQYIQIYYVKTKKGAIMGLAT